MNIVQDDDRLVKNPVISIMCITFNQVGYIARALDSFLAQKVDVPFEILVNDDCSTDGTTQVLVDYQAKHPEVMRVITHEENQYSKGKSTMGEFVIPACRGEFAAMCEGDDYWTDPEKLQLQLDVMRRMPEISACVHATENVQAESEKRLSVMRYADHNCMIDVADALSNTQCYSTNSLFIRMGALLRYRDSKLYVLKCDGDQKMLVSFALSGGIFYIDRIMSAYRFMAKNSTNRSMFMSEKHAQIVAKKRDLRCELLRCADELSGGTYHPQVVVGLDRMEYLYHKDLRDARALRSRWPQMFKKESLPAKIDICLYSYAKPLHRIVFSMYY
jgi:glycosyltransferase involved in cell wall biosynthesis